MGWNTSIAGGGPWDPDILDALAPGYQKEPEPIDFGSASSSDSTGRVAIGILPNGMVVAASHSEYDALNDIALALSAKGKSGVFHLGSTVGYYEYRLYEFGGTVENRASEGNDQDFDDDFLDPDDVLALLDEEDGVGNVQLDEDGLLKLFLRTVGQSDWKWDSDLVMHYYSPTKS
jgi:hypothetical protein